MSTNTITGASTEAPPEGPHGPSDGEMFFSRECEKPGKLEVGGASRDSTGLGALEEGLISS